VTVSSQLLERFGLGTAQFGMHYGRFNRHGMPSQGDVREILEKAAQLGISCIDTAHAYGESEAVLGRCSATLKQYSIITKTPQFLGAEIRDEDVRFLREAFERSLCLMKQTSVHGLLIHHAPNLLQKNGEFLYREMVRIKEEGLVSRIGVSAYSGDIVEQIIERFPLDFVQLPINVLDRRLTESGSLYRIYESGTKIHARSVFLQGLILASPDSLVKRFHPVRDKLKAFHEAAKLAGVSVAHAAIHYLVGIPEIEKIIVGIDSMSQLENIFSGFPEKIEMNFDKFNVDNVDILNPTFWTN